MVALAAWAAAAVTAATPCADGDYLRMTPMAEPDIRLHSPALAAAGWPELPLLAQNVFDVHDRGSAAVRTAAALEPALMLPVLMGLGCGVLFSCGTSTDQSCKLLVAVSSRPDLATAWQLAGAPHLTIVLYPSATAWLEMANSANHLRLFEMDGYAHRANYTYGLFRSVVMAPQPSGMRPAMQAGGGTVVVHMGRPRGASCRTLEELEAGLSEHMATLQAALAADADTTARLSWAGVRAAGSERDYDKYPAVQTEGRWWATLLLNAATEAEADGLHLAPPLAAVLAATDDWVVLRPGAASRAGEAPAISGDPIPYPPGKHRATCPDAAPADDADEASTHTCAPTATPTTTPTAAPTDAPTASPSHADNGEGGAPDGGNSSGDSGGVSTGAIAGAAAGGGVGILLLVGLTWYCLMRKNAPAGTASKFGNHPHA